MNKLLFLCLAASSVFANAQFGDPSKATRTINTNGNIIDAVVEEKVEGSPFYSDAYQNSKISNVDFMMPLRYNLLHDELEFLKDAEVYVLPKVSTYKDIEFTATGEKLMLIHNAYYFVLAKKNGNHLLKKSSVSFTAARPSKNGYDASSPPKYSRAKDQFFIYTDKQILRPVVKNYELESAQGSKKIRFNLKNEQAIKQTFNANF